MSELSLPVTTWSRHVRGISCSPRRRWKSWVLCKGGNQKRLTSNQLCCSYNMSCCWLYSMPSSSDWAMIYFQFVIKPTICCSGENGFCFLISCATSMIKKHSFLFARCILCKIKVLCVFDDTKYKPCTKAAMLHFDIITSLYGDNEIRL